jgi:hypothetical protein
MKGFPTSEAKKVHDKKIFHPPNTFFKQKNLKVPMFSFISSIQWCNDILSTYRLISKAVSTWVHCTQQDIHSLLVISVIYHIGQWVNHACEACWWLRVVTMTRLITDYLTNFTLVLPTTKGIQVQKIDKCNLMVRGPSIYEIKKCGFNIAHCERLSILQCKIHITLCVYFATVYVCVHFLPVEWFITEQAISMATT